MKKQFEEELEDLKQNHETELSQLKDRLRKEKHSASAAISDQVSDQEEEEGCEEGGWEREKPSLLACLGFSITQHHVTSTIVFEMLNLYQFM